VRHGVIAANRSGRWHGSTDSPLLWRGRRQAKRTGRHFALDYPQPVAIYTSPLQRCHNTARFIGRHLKDLEPIVHQGLREYGIGEWEDMPFKELAKQHDFVNRATADPLFAPPQGESLQDVAQRMEQALVEINAKHSANEQVIVVSHGAAMAVALGVFLNEDPAQWIDYHFQNCSRTELVLEPTPYLNFFNNIGHL
jgi:broad specificity phosphatase PhoE